MKRLILHVTTEADDGTWTTHDVKADNRDLVRWDTTRPGRGWPLEDDARSLWLTFLAWSAEHRLGLTPLNFEKWSDNVVKIESDAIDVDPTRPGAEPD
jgi:hypothetical protein